MLIVGLSLRLTDSSGFAAEMPDLVNVCLWGLISKPYINCLDSVCRQSLFILLGYPPTPPLSSPSLPSVSISILALLHLRSLISQPPTKRFLTAPSSSSSVASPTSCTQYIPPSLLLLRQCCPNPVYTSLANYSQEGMVSTIPSLVLFPRSMVPVMGPTIT